MTNNHYLITGITGFAGAHLAQLLYMTGCKVHGLIRRSNGMQTDILDVVSQDCFDAITFHYADLTDHDALRSVFETNYFKGVFHLAAQSHPPTSLKNPLDTFRQNIEGTANLIDVIEKCSPFSKLMFCSTSEVYGNSGQDGRKLLETDPMAPSNPYAVSKAAMDLFMQERMSNGTIKGFVTRAFSHTGPRRGKNFSISADAYQIARIMRGMQDPVLEVGNLDTVRVVLDVRDVVNAYYLLMMNDRSDGKVFNVCGDTPHKMGFFTDKLIELSGSQHIEKKVSDKYYRHIDIYYQHGDTAALKALTHWEPLFTIERTMKDLLDYWHKKLA